MFCIEFPTAVVLFCHWWLFLGEWLYLQWSPLDCPAEGELVEMKGKMNWEMKPEMNDMTEMVMEEAYFYY